MKLGYAERYKLMLLPDEHKKYTKVDFALSIGYFLYLMITLFFIVWSPFFPDVAMWPPLKKILFGLFVGIIELAPLMFMLKYRKQSSRSIGFHKEKLMLSLIVGAIFVIPELIIFKIDVSLLRAISIQAFVIKFFYYFFCIALVEEIIFRGYLQSRIQGVITSKWLSVIVVGLLFYASHIPVEYFYSGQEFLPFMKNHLSIRLPYLCFSHFYFLLIYRLTGNIFSSTMTHAILDVIYS
jgi:uncharacterized protein